MIEATTPKDGNETILSKLIVTRQVKERFEAIRNVRLVGHMQHTISELFKKQVSFDSKLSIYEQVVNGYTRLFPDSTDQLCLDLKMRLRDAARSRVNLVLLKYTTETNSRWLSKIGVSPANYLKGNLSADTITSTAAAASF